MYIISGCVSLGLTSVCGRDCLSAPTARVVWPSETARWGCWMWCSVAISPPHLLWGLHCSPPPPVCVGCQACNTAPCQSFGLCSKQKICRYIYFPSGIMAKLTTSLLFRKRFYAWKLQSLKHCTFKLVFRMVDTLLKD